MPVIGALGPSRLRGTLVVCLFLLLPSPLPAAAPDELLLGVTLNEVDKGPFFGFLAADGDLLFAEEDLLAMGFRRLPGSPVEIDGRPHRSLRSLGGVTFLFDPDAVSATITATPSLLAGGVIDFLAGSAKDVERPVSHSAFLNLGVDYRDSGDSSEFQATPEVGIRRGDYLFLSDAFLRSGGEDDGFVRLMTRASWEDREERVRLTVGDVAAPARDLWATPILGGVSFSKLYFMDPYRVRHPTFGLAGQTPVPAQVQVYLDGFLVREEKLPPGEFEVRNLDAYGGDRQVEVVVRDIFGRETRIERPFYFTDAVLGRGLHEYSYNLGAVREDFGEESNRYGGVALSAFHRYGVTDALTLGIAGQAAEGVVSAGPTLALVAGSLGVVSLALSAGRMDGEGGYAGLAAYEYENGRFGARARYERFSSAYRTLLDADDSDLAGTALAAGVSYGTPSIGTIALSWLSRSRDEGDDRTRLAAEYTLGLFGKASLHASVAQVDEGGDPRTEFSAGVSYYPDPRRTVSAEYSRLQGMDQATLEIASDRTDEEGLAWRGAAQWQEDRLTLRPWAEYRGRHGIVAGDAALGREEEDRYGGDWNVSAAASLYAAGGTVGIGRPVTDSFAVVKVGRDKGLPNVRVYRGGSESGATGDDGTLFLPDVGSYVHNQISIEPKDIPLDYSIAELMRVISPAARSGSAVLFDATRYQAVTGRLVVTEAGEPRPLEYVEIGVRAGERAWSVPSGKGGEFFLENAGTGRVVLSFRDRGEERSCAIVIPASEEIVVDIGEVRCEIAP